jgi:hypothetical protein
MKFCIGAKYETDNSDNPWPLEKMVCDEHLSLSAWIILANESGFGE